MTPTPGYGPQEYAELRDYVVDRDGPEVDACHIVAKQTIKSVFSRGAVFVAGVGLDTPGAYRRLRADEVPYVVAGYVLPDLVIPVAVNDARNVVAGFRARFHSPFDAGEFRLPLPLAPPGFRDFVDEFGLHIEAEARVDCAFRAPA